MPAERASRWTGNLEMVWLLFLDKEVKDSLLLIKLTNIPTPPRKKNYFFPRIMFSNDLKNLCSGLEGAAKGVRDLAMLDLMYSCPGWRYSLDLRLR